MFKISQDLLDKIRANLTGSKLRHCSVTISYSGCDHVCSGTCDGTCWGDCATGCLGSCQSTCYGGAKY